MTRLGIVVALAAEARTLGVRSYRSDEIMTLSRQVLVCVSGIIPGTLVKCHEAIHIVRVYSRNWRTPDFALRVSEHLAGLRVGIDNPVMPGVDNEDAVVGIVKNYIKGYLLSTDFHAAFDLCSYFAQHGALLGSTVQMHKN